MGDFISIIICCTRDKPAIVLQFGDPKKIVTKAGLNFKLPFIQNVVYLDRRILNLDNDPEEAIAADQKD